MTDYHDMHCHLDFMADAACVAGEARAHGTLLFANTVTPAGWEDAHRRLAPFPNVAVGFGMHPWWISEAEHAAVMRALEAHGPSFIGEVGLDFGRRHAEARDAQLRMFSSIAAWAAASGGKLLSVHSVGAACETLDVLEQSGAAETCTCLLHWYSGPSDQLKRAVELGCFFSCGPRMLATRKGREYVKAVPATRLLLETDAPPSRGAPYSYAELRAELKSAARDIAAVKGAEVPGLIAETSRRLLTRKS